MPLGRGEGGRPRRGWGLDGPCIRCAQRARAAASLGVGLGRGQDEQWSGGTGGPDVHPVRRRVVRCTCEGRRAPAPLPARTRTWIHASFLLLCSALKIKVVTKNSRSPTSTSTVGGVPLSAVLQFVLSPRVVLLRLLSTLNSDHE